jgi:hypothetical protein
VGLFRHAEERRQRAERAEALARRQREARERSKARVLREWGEAEQRRSLPIPPAVAVILHRGPTR